MADASRDSEALAPDVPTSDRSSLPILRLKRGEERRICAGHLWVFSNEVDTVRTALSAIATGAIVQIQSYRGQFLGYAYVNPHALICARIVGRDIARPFDRVSIAQRLETAQAMRRFLGEAVFCRLVFGESDGLPGLILDRYDDILVGQIATAGMQAHQGEIEAAIRLCVDARTLYWKNDSAARDLEQLPAQSHVAFGTVPELLQIEEGGLRFQAPLAQGQKTGWFYDQTANRARMARYLRPGARVLDVCSYVGAWAITAMRFGAGSAHCIDSSRAALALAAENARANGFPLEVTCSDAFDALRALNDRGERFDVVILDPPAFIKRKKDVPQGQAAYRKLNQLALGLLHDGVLISCSCSYHLAAGELMGAIQAAARHSGRFVQILEAGGQSPDHPIHPAIAETRYLKAFFCRVIRE